MPTKIRLEFHQDLDVELSRIGYWLPIIRIIANVQFLLSNQNFGRKYKAILDTGNPITIIPRSIWQQVHKKILLEQLINLKGIGQGLITGQIAHVWLAFVDEKRTSKILEIPAFLVSDDSIPLIIGFHKVLSNYKLICDYQNGRAFLKIR